MRGQGGYKSFARVAGAFEMPKLAIMSNVQRIWITYALISIPPMLLLVFLMASTATQMPDDQISMIMFSGIVLWVASLFMHHGVIAKCVRCKAPLHLSPLGWYAPIVTWRRCPKCGLRHSNPSP